MHNSRHQNWLLEFWEWPQKGFRAHKESLKKAGSSIFVFISWKQVPSCRARWHPSRSISSSSFLHECLKSLNLYLTESHWSIHSKLPLSKFSVFGRSGNLEPAGNFTEVGQVGFSEAEETRYSVTVLQCYSVWLSHVTLQNLCVPSSFHTPCASCVSNLRSPLCQDGPPSIYLHTHSVVYFPCINILHFKLANWAWADDGPNLPSVAEDFNQHGRMSWLWLMPPMFKIKTVALVKKTK